MTLMEHQVCCQLSAAVPVEEQTAEQTGVVLTRLLDEHGDSLLRVCTLYLKDRSLAEDALQGTLLKALRAWPRFRGECSEKSFLTGIAINICKGYLRSPWHKRRVALTEWEGAAQAPQAPDDTLPRAIMALPVKYRDVVVLYYYQELKTDEVAKALGLSVPAVTMRLSRARRMLKGKLKGWYYDEQ